ncbi:MAG: cold shock domain-containing protein [Alphaproteobacteria bacterium]|nr:cold shock domain-containing protein [Alphaproteobacteria bacterium]
MYRLSRYDLGTAMPAGEGVQADGIVKWFNGSKGFGFVAINNNSSDAFLHISVVTRAGLQGLAENTRLRCMVAPSDRGMQVTHILEVMGVDQNAPQSHGREQRQDSYARDNFSRDNFTRDNFTRDNFSARDHGSGDHRGLSDFGGRDSFSNNSYSNNFDAPPRQQHQPRQATGPEVEVVGSIKWYKTDKGFGFAMPEDGSKDVFIHRSILERVGLDNIDPGRKIRMMVTSSQKGREATRIDLLD